MIRFKEMKAIRLAKNLRKTRAGKFVGGGLLMGLLWLLFYLAYPVKHSDYREVLLSIDPAVMIVSTFVLLAIFFVYVQGLTTVGKTKKSTRIIFWLSVALGLVLLMVPLVNSNDLQTYIYRSRIFSHHRQNPYLV